MTRIIDYTTLVEVFQDYLVDEDTDTQTDLFLQQAEERLYTEARLRCMQPAPYQFSPLLGILPLPGDFLEPVSITLAANPDLSFVYVPPDVFANDRRRTLDGPAKIYTILGENVLLAPMNTGLDVLIYYYARFVPLNPSIGSNVNPLFSFSPMLYLYAMLAEAQHYVREEGAPWEQKYQQKLASLHAADVRSRMRPGTERRRY